MPVRILILVGVIAFFWRPLYGLSIFLSRRILKKTKASIDELDKKLTRAKLERAKLPERQKEKEEVEFSFRRP